MEKGAVIDWRSKITERCGGRNFDAPGGGYSFSDVLAEERALEKFNQKDEPESALLKLSVADPTWKMNPLAMIMAEKYYQGESDATRYTDNTGVKNWMGKDDTNVHLAAYLNERFADGRSVLTEANVQYSPGSIKRALAEYIPTLLFDRSKYLIFPTPGYPVIKSPMNIRGAEVRDVPLILNNGKWNIDFAVISMFTEYTDFQCMMYVNVPHNPTGFGYTQHDWQQLLGWARRFKVLLIVDEAYIDLCYNKDIVSVLTMPGWEDCCIVLQSVSKGYSATGLRFGWMVAHPIVIKALRKVVDVKDSGLFGPSIAAGLTCLENPQWAEETRTRYYALHQKLYDALIGVGFKTSFPDAGLCQFTPAPKSANGVEFPDSTACAKWFREKLRISLMNYMVNNEPWLRWAVTIKPVPECGLPDEISVIEEVVRRIKEVEFSF